MSYREAGSTDWPSRVYWAASAVASIAGVALVARGFHLDLTGKTGTDGVDFVGPGSTLLAAVLAGLVTRAGFVTWQEQRRRDRESLRLKHQEEVYEELVRHMVARFVGGGYDIQKDGELRASAVTWSDPATIRALGNWQALISGVLATGPADVDGSVSLTNSQGRALKDALADVVLAMRADLQGGDLPQPKKGEILASIFNDN